jgi:hypothetical protein
MWDVIKFRNIELLINLSFLTSRFLVRGGGKGLLAKARLMLAKARPTLFLNPYKTPKYSLKPLSFL